MTVELEDTIIPMNEVTAKPMGMVKNCDQRASFGFLAKRLKSVSSLEMSPYFYVLSMDSPGSFTIKVAKFAILLIIPCTIAQPNASPFFTEGCCTMGPIPSAFTIAQMKNISPATGTK